MDTHIEKGQAPKQAGQEQAGLNQAGQEQAGLNFEWVDNPEQFGEMNFTFDGEKVFNLFEDYPNALTKEQKAVFDRENPYWKEYFEARQ